MADENPDFTKTPCSTCKEVSTEDELMVGCDSCKLWFHTRCVNFNPADKKSGKKWYCPDKDCQKKKKTKKSVEVPLPVPPELQEKLDALEETRKRAEAEQEMTRVLKEKEFELAAYLEERQMKIDEELREKEATRAEKLRERDFKRREADLAAEMVRKEEHLKRIQQLETTFRDKSASIDKLLKNSSTPLRNPEVKPLTEGNVAKHDGREDPKDNPVKPGDIPVNPGANPGTPGSNPGSTKSSKKPESSSDSSSASSVSTDANGDEKSGKAAKSTKVDVSKPDGLGQHGLGPTKAQRAARQGLTRKLPDFHGKPEEWPLFFAAYQASNEACGYTDVENLVRLQDCLKGRALEEVRGQLILPKSVPRVIAKLRQIYGRPEVLLQSHLQRVRKLEPPRADKLGSFIPFGNAVEQLCEHIEAAELTAHLVNPILIQELVDKLPDGEKRSWVHYKRKKREVNLRTLTNFLSKIVEDACEATVNLDYKPDVRAASGSSGRSRNKEKAALFNHSVAEESTERREQKQQRPCKACQRTDHRLWNCEDFKKLPYEDRVKMATKWKLCQRCLNDHGGQCKLKLRCNVGECREPHNALLHPETRAVGMNAHITSTSPVLFRMLPVKVYCGERSMIVLAFLDEGSSLTLIESGLADRLGLLGTKEKLTIKWTANITRVEQHSRRTNLWASAINGSNGEKLLLQSVRTVDKLMLPRQTLNAAEVSSHYDHLRGLPMDSYDGRPGMLIGLNNIHSFAPLETKVGTIVDPVAVRCKLGWTVYGPRDAESAGANCFLGCHQEVTNEELHDLLKSHYSLEEAVVTVQRESVEDQRARKIMEETTRRVGDRFETGLLWKTDDVKFPNSYPMAVKRMKQLEKKLERSPELYDNVKKQILDYQAKGYAHEATAEELNETDNNKAFYLPLNVVVNPKKPGKVRLVWDAAATIGGVSLNSMLVKGPDLLVPLVSVICGFRERRVAFGGDIREMYHQLKIISGDKQAQRFLFRDNINEEPKVYVMDVATFGSKSSPASAQYVKNRNAEEHAGQYPDAVAAIINRHYVDDYFDSVDTVEEAVKRAKQVSHVHKQGGFEIRNWVSNSPEVLTALGEKKPMSPVLLNQDKQTPSERVLGVRWDPEMDEFAFAVMHREELMKYLKEGKRPTKRIVLSCVMGFFDPLGLLSPFTIHGKIIIQHLWRTGCRWDQAIDDEAWILWKRWTALLPEVEALRFPRSYFGDAMSTSVESLELHIFSDASELAYGCAAYLRAVIDGQVHCSLVMARSKVAPLKRQSIPRLELMAACMGARMSQQILGTHTLQIDRTVFWTDSRTVLAWLRADPYKYKQFVAFRVGEILELTRLDDWRWVPSKKNIADVLTKWGPGPPLQNDSEWRNGPAILFEQDDLDSPPEQIEETNEEARGVVLFHGTVNVEAVSTWTKLVRVTATAVRFIENCRRKKDGRPVLTAKATSRLAKLVKAQHETDGQPLQQDELQKAERILWKQAQFESFPDEMSVLTKNLQLKQGELLEKIERSSPLYKLLPVLDEDGVLRVRGRLEKNASIPFDKRFPIILGRKHAVTKKIIQHYHEKYGHANRETVFNELRQKFWIPNARAAILEVVKECVWCKVNRCVPFVPTMAPLPVERTAATMRPFSAVGVDYLGPVEVTVGRRREKRWIAVFTCLAVRAVHLEVVHSLTTQSCLMALRRFACKRGVPEKVFSDNATCFRGADAAMTKAINKECAEQMTSATTAWSFIPPGTPHMGGAWERMVRSVKEALRALDDGRKLTDEILSTSLAEAEDMINTRPLTYVPQESAEEEAITPNHFLRGTVTSADLKLDETVDTAAALRDVYKRSQQLAGKMWERWSKEYLPSLNRRPKWFEDRKPLEAGDLVFVVDGKNRKSWVRGRVVEVVSGSDGRVRQADVRTADGKVNRRAVVNLAVLEIRDGKSDAPEGPTDLTGWGVATAGMGTLAGGATPAV
ncbi:uncharacterized protein LOC119769264 [Culex quinquefasciatus]|uniref:uncharacterized protein LOC119769264 n=1 Tax=Culex quinquefasciatus TaxID=7176 RepID=UPI0018E36023|nr:uncharacterized protein LOC119769264 [Culex quinquefasciatus]